MANLKGGTTVGRFRSVHTGNIVKVLTARDGHGSGIDADLLDGRHASDFSLTSHNHDGNYVRKTGDTMTGDLEFRGGSSGIRIVNLPGSKGIEYFNSSGKLNASIGVLGSNLEQPSNAFMGVTSSPWDGVNSFKVTKENCYFNNQKIWNAGNDGSGSGLDADMIDGIQSDRIPYGRNDTCTNLTDDTNKLWKAGFYEMNGGANTPVSGSDWWWMAKLAHGSNRSDYRYGTIIAGRNGYNQLFFKNAKQDGTGTWCQLWHDKNMGHHSGLDADMVDGIQSTRIVYGGNDTATTNTTTIDILSKSGFYRPEGGTATNNTMPENHHSGIIHCNNTNYPNYFFQIAVPYDINNKIYFRNKINGSLTQWHRIYHTENKPTPAEVGAVNKTGDTMTGDLYFSSTSSIRMNGYSDAGGWATGLSFNKKDGSRHGGMGLYGSVNESEYFYIGYGSSPWDSTTGLTVSKSAIKFKNYTVWHYGNMGHGSNLDADKIDGKHWSDIESTFVKKSGDTMIGNLTVNLGAEAFALKTRQSDHVYMAFYPRNNSNTRGGFIGFPDAGSTILTMSNSIGTLGLSSVNKTILMNGVKFDISTTNPTGTERLNIGAYVHATRFYGAVYNDYAEYFEKDKNEEFEPGDLICLDESSDEEVYIKSKKPYSPNVVGVYSDEYAQCIGGKGDGKDEENYLPIGLAGRVRVKVIGKVTKGDLLVSSGVEGYAMASTKYIPGTVIGKALENKTSVGEGKVRMLINLQ